jgi:hypothetical protein
VLIPDLVFPIYKIDRKQSEKKVSKERLKIPEAFRGRSEKKSGSDQGHLNYNTITDAQ